MDDDFPLRDFKALRLLMEEQWEIPPDFDRQMWALCSERADRLLKTKEYGELSKLYLHMAEFLHKEGKPSHCVREEAIKALLLQYRAGGDVSTVEIVCAEDGCPECHELSGRTFSPEDALTSMPIPHDRCSSRDLQPDSAPACRCTYRPLP